MSSLLYPSWWAGPADGVGRGWGLRKDRCIARRKDLVEALGRKSGGHSGQREVKRADVGEDDKNQKGERNKM